ncbi:hypothetical protein SDC9_97240 [bioreactor metagenome]|uniref:Uncharacterized protein n=1 Tax=bioreactor metagenome TaxID=1076179 RepID=A0A645ACS3_9ZZZZ
MVSEADERNSDVVETSHTMHIKPIIFSVYGKFQTNFTRVVNVFSERLLQLERIQQGAVPVDPFNNAGSVSFPV